MGERERISRIGLKCLGAIRPITTSLESQEPIPDPPLACSPMDTLLPPGRQESLISTQPSRELQEFQETHKNHNSPHQQSNTDLHSMERRWSRWTGNGSAAATPQASW